MIHVSKAIHARPVIGAYGIADTIDDTRSSGGRRDFTRLEHAQGERVVRLIARAVRHRRSRL